MVRFAYKAILNGNVEILASSVFVLDEYMDSHEGPQNEFWVDEHIANQFSVEAVINLVNSGLAKGEKQITEEDYDKTLHVYCVCKLVGTRGYVDDDYDEEIEEVTNAKWMIGKPEDWKAEDHWEYPGKPENPNGADDDPDTNSRRAGTEVSQR